MRALIQRVERAQVEVGGAVVGSCGAGYLVLLGVAPGDDEALAERLWRKVAALRICADEAGKTNRSLVDTGGDVLVVSQFTLYADARRGNRPSFTGPQLPSWRSASTSASASWPRRTWGRSAWDAASLARTCA